MNANRYKVSFWGGNNVLELVISDSIFFFDALLSGKNYQAIIQDPTESCFFFSFVPYFPEI